ncbi:MAG TPA: lamin tail domain-containing protein [Bacteroidota bacterium]
MKLARVGRVAVGLVLISNIATGQVASFPYLEHFDSIADSTLPAGWETTTNRRSAGDFFASRSTPRSAPHCVYAQNSIIPQSLTSPVFDLSNRTPDKLQFYVARSSSHTSGLLVEASIDGGISYPIALSDTIKNPGSTSYILNSIQLPGTLAHQPEVRIRWRVTGGTGGATGTLRIDDVTITTLISRDLAVTGLIASPQPATLQDSLVLKATVKNLGIFEAAGYSIKYFCDFNSNGIPEDNEAFAEVTGPSIPPSDSATIIARHTRIKAGDYRFCAVVICPGDERSVNDTAWTSLTVGYPKGSLLVNEVMYAPVGDEPEWIELLNCSGDTVNLKNWRISDGNVSTKTVVTTSNLFIAPAEYCIVAKDANFASIHPDVSCSVLVAGFSALNNTTPDNVIIYDARLISMDSIYYTPAWGGQDGTSLERVDIDQNSLDPKNWGTSQNPEGSTPGKPNSIVRLAYDLSAGRLYETRAESENGLIPVINFVVHNNGKVGVSSYTVSFYLDSNHDNTGDMDELITTTDPAAPLRPGDSAQYAYVWQSVPSGESTILAVIGYSNDLRTNNNATSMMIQTRYTQRSLVVNEIMFDPLSNQNEWIELVNRSGAVVDVKNWKFRDRPTASGSVNAFTIVRQPVFVRPGDFIVVAADSTILRLHPDLVNPPPGCHCIILNESGGFSLGNDGDDIVLEDLTGFVIDSVSYATRWHRPDVTDTKGRSLERINPDLDSNSPSNWTTSVVAAGGTPGSVNSTRTVAPTSAASFAFSPNPFSPDGDGFEDFCLIQYNLPFQSALIHMKIFDTKGRLVRTLANTQISSSHGEILWDGMDAGRRRVRTGPYIILLQATDSNGKASTALKGVVVVAARL